MQCGRAATLSTFAISLVVAAAVSPLVAAGTTRSLEEVHATSENAHAMGVCWGDDAASGKEAWTIRVRAGTSPPSTSVKPVASLPAGGSSCHVVGGLRANVPYTFLVIVRRAGGGELGRGSTTEAAHVTGGFVAAGARASRLPGAPAATATFVVGRRATEKVAAVYPAPTASTDELLAAQRSPSGAWTPPVQLYPYTPYDLIVTGNDRGEAIAAWGALDPSTGGDVADFYSLRSASGAWSPYRPLWQPAGASRPAYLRAVTLDDAGHMHVLVSRAISESGNDAISYDTDATGTWTERRVAGCSGFLGCDVSLLTYDPVRDRIVIVVRSRHQPNPDADSGEYGVVSIADKPARATAFGPAHRLIARAIAKRDLSPTSVASYAGQTTVALVSYEPLGEGSGGTTSARRQPPAPSPGLFVMSGSRPATVGRLTRVPGTSRRDAPILDGSPPTFGTFLVAATSRDRVALAWQKDLATWGPTWDPDSQGIWLRTRVRGPRTGRWSFRAPRHVSNTAYDILDSLSVGYRSAPVVGFHRG